MYFGHVVLITFGSHGFDNDAEAKMASNLDTATQSLHILIRCSMEDLQFLNTNNTWDSFLQMCKFSMPRVIPWRRLSLLLHSCLHIFVLDACGVQLLPWTEMENTTKTILEAIEPSLKWRLLLPVWYNKNPGCIFGFTLQSGVPLSYPEVPTLQLVSQLDFHLSFHCHESVPWKNPIAIQLWNRTILMILLMVQKSSQPPPIYLCIYNIPKTLLIMG